MNPAEDVSSLLAHFTKTPEVFVALRYIDVEHREHFMVKSKADNITPAGFRATVGKYGGDNWSMVGVVPSQSNKQRN